MEIADIKKGVTFSGFLNNEYGKEMFEAVILNVEEDVSIYQIFIHVDVLAVITKSPNPKRIGYITLLFFNTDDLQQFDIIPNHFVAVDNLYPILNAFNPSDEYAEASVTLLDENYDSTGFSSDAEVEFDMVLMKMKTGEYIQMIVRQNTDSVLGYMNPYVWLNITKDKDEILGQDKLFGMLALPQKFLKNVIVENIHENYKVLYSFGIAPNDEEYSHFNGIGISNSKSDDLDVLVFDLENEDERVTFGNGVYITDKD